MSSPAMAQAGTETHSVPGHRVAYDLGQAPAGLVTTARQKPAGDDDDDEVTSKKKCCKKCPPGPPGPPGPRGRADGIDTTTALLPGVAAPVKYIALAQSNGVTLLRDPTAAPGTLWKDLSAVSGYPGNASDVSLATSTTVAGTSLHVTVHTSTGLVFQSVCGPLAAGATFTGVGGICGAFVNLTPPL
jgi:hypothetical protein